VTLGSKPAAAQKSAIAAIILAAGRSTRFQAAPDDTKLVAPLFGKPMVRHVAEAALASRARPIFAITGHAARKVAAALAGLEISLVENQNYRTGLSSSLKAGIAALPRTATGAIILLADMPRVPSALIDRLIEAFEASRPPSLAAAPVRDGSCGNPVLIGRALFEAVGRLEGDRGARILIEAAGKGLLECPVSDDSTAFDIDTLDALRRCQSEAAMWPH
jgi:molybdenum cofactor cytidylyltransferase